LPQDDGGKRLLSVDEHVAEPPGSAYFKRRCRLVVGGRAGLLLAPDQVWHIHC
jgi:hypothetical protein